MASFHYLDRESLPGILEKTAAVGSSKLVLVVPRRYSGYRLYTWQIDMGTYGGGKTGSLALFLVSFHRPRGWLFSPMDARLPIECRSLSRQLVTEVIILPHSFDKGHLTGS
jgi:hypothetical protein